jgi:ubiquinone/menaquinone biosynthesis C-methylase UbiE
MAWINRPEWWQDLPEDFASRCHYVSINDWQLSPAAEELKEAYNRRHGASTVERRIHMHSWKRADICCHHIKKCASLIDIGSGLGEFVNLYAGMNPDCRVASVDIADFDLWFDQPGRIERVYSDMLDLGDEYIRDVVTCFQVLEHLRPELVPAALEKLHFLAKKKLYVSVPFKEPEPIFRGHYSRFETEDIIRMFPTAKYTMLEKNKVEGAKPWIWILCEIDMA